MKNIVSSISFIIIIIIAFNCIAKPPLLENNPELQDKIGDAFIEAWISFRADLDTMSHGNVHPQLLENWFAQMPRFLVRDAANLSGEPQVSLAAAATLSKNATTIDRHLLKKLENKYIDTSLHFSFVAFQILGGDNSVLMQTKAALNAAGFNAKVKAAGALFAANIDVGNQFLKRQIETCSDAANMAARMFGKLGTDQDDKMLIKAYKSCKRSALLSASGEIRLRKTFPLHYKMISRRDPTSKRTIEFGGLYDAWFIASGKAIQSGANDSKTMIEAIETLRHNNYPGQDNEIVKRELKQFIEFWQGTDKFISITSAMPVWPRNYNVALDNIRAKDVNNTKKQAIIFEKRMSAAISVSSFAAKKLNYDKLAFIEIPANILTPNGGRVSDENFATSWHAKAGDKLQFSFDTQTKIKEIYISNFCPWHSSSNSSSNSYSNIVKLEIGADDNLEKAEVYNLIKKTNYYQKITLKKSISTTRLTIKIKTTNSDEPTCISELRFR